MTSKSLGEIEMTTPRIQDNSLEFFRFLHKNDKTCLFTGIEDKHTSDNKAFKTTSAQLDIFDAESAW